jgi:hypothetical protein
MHEDVVAPVVEATTELVVATTPEIVRAVLMTTASLIGVFISGKQAYTGIMSRIR